MPKLFTTKPTRLEWVAILLIIALAAFLRLGWSGNVQFRKDSINLSQLALDMVHGHSFPLLGIKSSVGLPNAPMSVYLMAIPYAFSDSPLVASGYVALLNVVAVGMLYALGRRYYGPSAGLLAALLYAVSPRAIIYSRFIWQQNLLPVFVIATVATALLGFLEGKRWAQLAHLPLLAITLQIHYAAIVLVPITLVLMVIGRRKLVRELYIGLAISVLVMLPFALGALSLVQAGTAGKSVNMNGTSGGITITNAAEFNTQLAISGELLKYASQIRPEEPFFRTLPWVALLSALWLLFRLFWRRDERSPIDLTLLLWLTTTTMIFSFTWTAVYLHYMITLMPGAFLVIGVAVADLLVALTGKWPRIVFLTAGGIGLAVVLSVQIYVTLSLNVAGNIPNIVDSIGVPLGYYMTLRDNILAKHPTRVMLKLDEKAPFGPDGNVWNILLYNGPSIQYLSGGTDIYPAEKALYVSHDCTGQVEIFRLTNPDGCYAISWHAADTLDLSGYTRINASQLTFSTGASLIAYRWQPDQGCVTLAWKLNQPMPPDAPPGYVGPNYQFALQFYNTDRTLIVPVSDIGWQADYLHVGDIGVKTFCVNQPVHDIAGVRVRMYFTGGAQGYAAQIFDANRQFIGQERMNIPFVPNLAPDLTM